VTGVEDRIKARRAAIDDADMRANREDAWVGGDDARLCVNA